MFKILFLICRIILLALVKIVFMISAELIFLHTSADDVLQSYLYNCILGRVEFEGEYKHHREVFDESLLQEDAINII